MGAMASQITSLTIVYSTVYSGADEKSPKLRVTGLCVWNSPGSGEFPAQRASNAENVSIWWRHHASWVNLYNLVRFFTANILPQYIKHGKGFQRTGQKKFRSTSFSTCNTHNKCTNCAISLYIEIFAQGFKQNVHCTAKFKIIIKSVWSYMLLFTLQWRHNERNAISTHRCLDYLLSRLFRCRSKKTSKLHVTGLCEGNPPVTGGFPHKGPVTRKNFPFDNVIMAVRKWFYKV